MLANSARACNRTTGSLSTYTILDAGATDWPTRALKLGAVQPAPANTQFAPATTAANLAAQQAASTQPQTPRPGATQSFPYLRK
jgi:hypothetical protein